MDLVYACAAFTIVALHGNSVKAGLPGVSTRPRSSIQQVRVRNGRLRSTFPPLKSAIDWSVWATRGWTFQEFRLSRRCLFFTDYQVYFSCSEATSNEALPQISSIPTLAGNFNSKYNDQILDSTGAGLKGFFLDRMKYTKWNLSHEKDILNAFRGIIGLHSFVTLWGIPITCAGWDLNPCVGFAKGLLWETMREDDNETNGPAPFPRRRPGFPTWSWTSVSGQIEQYRISETQYIGFLESDLGAEKPSMDRLESAIKVEMPKSSETLAETIRNTKTKILPELSTSIIVEGDILRLTKGKVWPHTAVFHFRHEDGTLDFQRPCSATIDVTGPGEQPAATAKTLEGVQDALVIFELTDDTLEKEIGFDLMLLRWVGHNIAERVGLVETYEEGIDKAFVDFSCRHLKFELI